MLKVLIKKQLMEVFRGYFYDAKKNKARSKGSVILWFAFFAFIMVGVLGVMFTGIAKSLCRGLVSAGVDWMYFLIMSGLAIVLGAFGSVFNTFSGLYLGKDNDLLLSMPIPVRYIITSRLVNVYLMGMLYSSVVIIPTIVVYWINAGITLSSAICSLILFLIISFVDLLLSCILGWGVAKISLKLKNKSYITVLISLLFMAAYYFFYYKANQVLTTIIQNAAIYGEKVKGSAYALYLFGKIGEGDFRSAGIFLIGCIAVLALTLFVLSKTFLSIATSSSNVAKKKVSKKEIRQKSVFEALLAKELGRFTSSPNYMLNCGLGIITIPVAGILLIVKGNYLFGMLNSVFGAFPGLVPVLFCALLCTLSSMNDMAAPSVSLEGKNLWIAQSLPVEPKMILRAKMVLQLVLSGIPLLFTSICAACVIKEDFATKIFICIVPLAFGLFSAAFSTFIGVNMPNLTWTNEIVPIKQSASVAISMFGQIAIGLAFAGIYYLLKEAVDVKIYFAAGAAVFAAASVILIRLLDTKGAKTFSEL